MAIVATLTHRRGRVGIPHVLATVVRMNNEYQEAVSADLSRDERAARQQRLRDYAMAAAVGRPLFGR